MLTPLTLLMALSSADARAGDALSLEAALQAHPTAPGSVAPAGAVRIGVGRLTAAGEGRALGEGAWIGRATGTVDLLGRSDRLDLTVGGFAGLAGGLASGSGATPTYGIELGAGLHLGRFEARYRRAMGLIGPLSGALSEDELRAGIRVGEDRRALVFGQAVHLRAPADGVSTTGLGAGLALRF